MTISSDRPCISPSLNGEVDRGFLVMDNGFKSLFAWLYRIVIR
jgi:hypothetical protein